MIFNSIRTSLQLWYGLLLLVILTGFGFTAGELERGHLLGRVNGELGRRASVLAGSLRHPPPRADMEDQPFDGPPPGQFPGDGGPEDRPGPPQNSGLPREVAGLFDPSDPNQYFYLMRSRDGANVQKSSNAPPESVLAAMTSATVRPPPGQAATKFDRAAPPEFEIHGDSEIGKLVTPMGGIIYVGCSIAPELGELHRFVWRLALVGAGILALGLAGGWWLAGRAIRPINDISAAAAKISAGDLSQRISQKETESELGKLAGVLNSTFARLETAFAQQQQFTSDAAHELRTPVTVMLTQTQLALSRERTAAEYRQTLEACRRAAQRMRRLTESLLALARLDAGQEPMKRFEVNLEEVIRESAELVQPLAAEKSVTVKLDLQSVKCLGDQDRLAQVLTNLITNAIQYNRAQGEVAVALAAEGGQAVMTVRDTGMGIPAEELPRVFERFFRSDKSRTAGGNGLGLSICKAIIVAHGGTIEVASEAGAGTTFTIRLPV